MPSEPDDPAPDRLVSFEELRNLFPQLIRAGFADATDEQMATAQRIYDEQLSAIAGPGWVEAMFTTDQAVEALRRTLDLLERG
jgi:hypothetical protein